MLISADDHFDPDMLPADLWTSRLPGALRDEAPRVIATPAGLQWVAGNDRWGRPFAIPEPPDSRTAHGSPADRLARMQQDGVAASVIYPPPTRFPVANQNLRTAVLRAYNDWALEYMAFAPHALAVVAQLPTHDPAAAVEELQRVARAGHRGVQLGPHESETPPFEDAWLPFWAAAEEAGLPVSFHINGGVRSIRSILGSWRRPAMVSVLPFQLDETISGLVFSGILARHPRLRVVMAESGIGWLPYFFDRLDLEHVNYQPDTSDVVLAEPPSFYLKRQVRFTWGDDRIGAVLIPDLGADCVMWASDYPHADSTWPNSREVLSTLLAHLSEADRGKVTRDNAAQLYALSPDSPACG